MNKMKPAVKRAVTALGFDSQSWYLFAAVVRSKYAGWLEKIEQAKEKIEQAKENAPEAEVAEAEAEEAEAEMMTYGDAVEAGGEEAAGEEGGEEAAGEEGGAAEAAGKEGAEEAAGEEDDSDAPDGDDDSSNASLSQHDPDEIPDEAVVNGKGKEDPAFPDQLYTPVGDDGGGCPLTGFPTNLSDAEDGRDDDVPPMPKKWKSATGRKWETRMTSITTLKQDLRKVTLETFTKFYVKHHSYKEYVLDLIESGKLSSLPEVVYVAQANVTRKQEAEYDTGSGDCMEERRSARGREEIEGDAT